MWMKAKGSCVLGLFFLATSGLVHAAAPAEYVPNLEKAVYLCTGTGVVIEAHIGSKIEGRYLKCNAAECAYKVELIKDGKTITKSCDGNDRGPFARASTDGADSWTLVVVGEGIEVVTQFFGDVAFSSNLGPTPHEEEEEQSKTYPKVSCTLSLKQ
jgi:hypothetical protein